MIGPRRFKAPLPTKGLDTPSIIINDSRSSIIPGSAPDPIFEFTGQQTLFPVKLCFGRIQDIRLIIHAGYLESWRISVIDGYSTDYRISGWINGYFSRKGIYVVKYKILNPISGWISSTTGYPVQPYLKPHFPCMCHYIEMQQIIKIGLNALMKKLYDERSCI